MAKFFLYISMLAVVFNACSGKKKAISTIKANFDSATATPVKPPSDEVLIEITTTYGVIKARLFNETPRHRDNMVKLIKKGFYDSLLFHRVIKSFVIQGGDPDSKNAAPEKLLGEGDVGYTVPSEFMPEKYFHKKGALAAAREGDDVNPAKASSGCQFYIVQGKIQDDALLEKNERRINRAVMQKITDSLLALPVNEKLKSALQRIKDNPSGGDSLSIIQKQIDDLTEPVYKSYAKYKIPEEQRAIYKKIGGTPHLDTHYTVFGEVYEGLEVLDKIAAVATDSNDRPKKDVKMVIKIIREP